MSVSEPNKLPAPSTLSSVLEEPTPVPLSALVPLKNSIFRLLWIVWIIANTCTWMNDVAAAWMMTSLTASPVWVALVQTASTLPVFMLGLPSGALADILDRRRYFIATQLWVVGVALILCAAVITGKVTPLLLLSLTFANGIGLAMRWPVFAAIVPELVSRPQLPAALALNGIALNSSRIAGPLIAGLVIASAGTAYVFILNAVLSMIAALMLLRWKPDAVSAPLGPERLRSAMRVGVQFVRQSNHLISVFLTVALFFFHSTSLLALLPLIARDLDGSTEVFTMLLASMGAGAISGASLLPRLRASKYRGVLVIAGALVQSSSTVAVALAPSVYVALPAMFLAGAGWLTVANSLNMSAQLALPNWVRARGMAMYQMSIMGAGAVGAALWGKLAALTSVQLSLLVSCIAGVAAMIVAHRVFAIHNGEEDLTSSYDDSSQCINEVSDSGQVFLFIEYCINPEQAPKFIEVMKASRRNCLRQGAIGWNLLHNAAEPGRYVEQVIDESWTEHLRRLRRSTMADKALRKQKFDFHRGDTPPIVTHWIMEKGKHV
ncbi:MFS transporter [Herbaspirillum sp. GCM10030257]|uniref:MFS transporter n=1 Tax=Herbaspirillum sp. GCM10030257 TaxID=3273393 RepID=UPI0036065C9B